MARQIIDLPRIDLADLADDDLLIIRDSNAKKDKRITVGDLKIALASDLGEGVVRTVNLADGAVTGEKVALDSIEPSNMKMSAFAPIWSVFVLEGVFDNKEIELTTRLGTKLVVESKNGCTGYVLKSGFRNIDFIRMRGSSKFSSTLTGNYGIHGLNSGVTIWTYVTGGASNASYFNSSARTSTASSDAYPAYGDLAGTTAGNKGDAEWSWTGMRVINTGTWHIFGDVHSGGSAVYVHHLTEVAVGNVDRGMPTFYQRGAGVSNVSYSKIVLEVLEYA